MMKVSLIFALILASSAVLWEARPVLAQEKFKTGIAGRVTDPRGAVIVGASISIIAHSTKKSIVVTTNDEGEYTADLALDMYDIEAEAPGFKKAKRKNIPVEGGRGFVDFMLVPKEEVACELRVGSEEEVR